MDVMAYPIYRSGNFKPQLVYVQAIFPDREIMKTLDSKLTPVYTQLWRYLK